MKTIVQRSLAIGIFLGLLGLPASLHTPQLRHLERLADLLIVTPRRKTLAELAAQELDGVDPSNLADFFRISPWDADAIRLPLVVAILHYLKCRQRNQAAPLFLILDDSLAPKDKGTRHLEPVDWFFDHKTKRTIRASNHLSLSISWGDFYFPLSERLYLRQATVRRRNRKRSKHHKLTYVSKPKLAQQLLEQVRPYLPEGVTVYVLFDSWYTSAKLVRWIRDRNWHVIAGVKSNRTVSCREQDSPKARCQKVSNWHNDFKGRPYERVRLGLANGTTRTYCVRSLTGRLRGVPGDVRLLISQKGPGKATPRYFLCTDVTLSCQEILKLYQNRWRIETDYWQVKMHLGLGDYRLRRYEAVAKWYSVVYLVLAYLYWRKYEHERTTRCTISLSEVIQAIRQHHQRECLRQACQEVAAGTPLEEVLTRYIGPEDAAAA
jgi:DDE superfamily endonuclease